MKIKVTPSGPEFRPETALDRATLEFPELTFDVRYEATRALGRCSVALKIRHNSMVIFRGGLQIGGFSDGEQHFDAGVEMMLADLLQRAKHDLMVWRTANPQPKPVANADNFADGSHSAITSSGQSDAASS